MKTISIRFFAILIGAFYLSILLANESRFITEKVRLPMRATKSTESRIVQFVYAGDQVILLEQADQWSKVQSGDAIGWMLSRYLVEKNLGNQNKISEKTVLELETKNRNLANSLNSSNELIDKIKHENSQLAQENNKLKLEVEFVQKTYEKNIEIEYQTQQLANELILAKNEINLLEQKDLSYQESSKQIWFILGGLTFLAGVLMGFILFRWVENNSRKNLFR